MSKILIGIKFFFLDLASDLIRWPIWWYTRGLVLFSQWMIASVKGYVKQLAIGVWMKNIFVPMFGRRDWQSRLISIFMRTVQIIGRSLFLFVWTMLMTVLFAVYVVAPISAAILFVYQLLALLVS